MPGTETADRERLGDYYLYPLSGRTTIANAQTKQVSFLDVQAVPAKKVYARSVGWLASCCFPPGAERPVSNALRIVLLCPAAFSAPCMYPES